MAQQLIANVYQIEGMPQGGAFPLSFPTNNVMMKVAELATISEVNSEINYYPNQKNPTFRQSFMVSESLASLLSSANDGNTSQLQASIYQINGNPITNQNICFPISQISIWPYVSGRANSFILFKGDKYYAGETRDALVAAANSGSGGSGGGTILQSPDNTLWQVQINDAGVLVTVQVESGTAGTLHLFSPDNTEWNITVNNAGALTTTEI